MRFCLIAALVLAGCSPPPIPLESTVQVLPDFVQLVKKTSVAVVCIHTTKRETMGPYQPIDPDSPALQGQDEVSTGVGSGFILSPDGFVLTAAHVVRGDTGIYVTLFDKREFKATVVGVDERSDIALLKINGTDLPTLKLGDVNKLQVGEWVVAIGSPFGMENTVTVGILSAKAREIEDTDLPLLQSDVVVNPGNSGGPLLNTRGEVIGINQTILTKTEVFMGITLAIPINDAMKIAAELRSTGKVIRSFFGIIAMPVPRELAKKHEIDKNTGAFVQAVAPDSPAADTGIQVGDIILLVDNIIITSPSHFVRTISSLKPNSRPVLRVKRGSEIMEFSPTLAELKET
jgi:serine protease Do